MNLIFDSNVFDDIVAGILPLDTFLRNNIKVYLTHIQIDELNNCSDTEKRAKLFLNLVEIRPEKISTETFILGVSRLGSAKLSDDDLFEKLRNGKLNRTNDALIGETAIKNRYILVTNDKELRRNVESLGGSALSVEDLITKLKVNGY